MNKGLWISGRRKSSHPSTHWGQRRKTPWREEEEEEMNSNVSLGSQQLMKQAESIHFIDEPTKVEKPECPAPNHRH